MIDDFPDSWDLLVLLCQVVVAPAQRQSQLLSNLCAPSVILTLSCGKGRKDKSIRFSFVGACGGWCIGVYPSDVDILIGILWIWLMRQSFIMNIELNIWTNLEKCRSPTQQETGIHPGPTTSPSWPNVDQLVSSVRPNVHAFWQYCKHCLNPSVNLPHSRTRSRIYLTPPLGAVTLPRTTVGNSFWRTRETSDEGPFTGSFTVLTESLLQGRY